LRDNGLMIRKRRTRKTTNSNHNYRKFENLIKDFIPTKPNMLWVSDITYVETENGVVYLSLITDAYSHKIVGWSVGETLEALYPLQALNMALETRKGSIPSDLIHHSDRGVQYCSHKYVDLLQNHDIRISMTQSGDPLENAVAERINGILKSEWLYHVRLKNLTHAKEYLHEIITYYNQSRPHLSINLLTPEQAHQMQGEIEKKWKNYYIPKEERGIA
ncbi:MAG: IS3 family transposase, partial [Bacteroidales bacterium]